MAILPLIALLLLLGILTGANFFALGACTFLIVIQLAKHFSSRWIQAVEVQRFVEAHEVDMRSRPSAEATINSVRPWWNQAICSVCTEAIASQTNRATSPFYPSSSFWNPSRFPVADRWEK